MTTRMFGGLILATVWFAVATCPTLRAQEQPSSNAGQSSAVKESTEATSSGEKAADVEKHAVTKHHDRNYDTKAAADAGSSAEEPANDGDSAGEHGGAGDLPSGNAGVPSEHESVP